MSHHGTQTFTFYHFFLCSLCSSHTHLLLKHAKHTFLTLELLPLFPLSGMFLPQITTHGSLPHFMQISVHMPPPQRSLSQSLFIKKTHTHTPTMIIFLPFCLESFLFIPSQNMEVQIPELPKPITCYLKSTPGKQDVMSYILLSQLFRKGKVEELGKQFQLLSTIVPRNLRVRKEDRMYYSSFSELPTFNLS